MVSRIKVIADQTNLLALNAMIEAAWAGAVERGFAAVASEVKAIAVQTAKATDEMTQQVTAIQGAPGEAVGAVESISAAVTKSSNLPLVMSTAVKERAASTDEMSGNIVGVSASAS